MQPTIAVLVLASTLVFANTVAARNCAKSPGWPGMVDCANEHIRQSGERLKAEEAAAVHKPSKQTSDDTKDVYSESVETIVLKDGTYIKTMGTWEENGCLKYFDQGRINEGFPLDQVDKVMAKGGG